MKRQLTVLLLLLFVNGSWAQTAEPVDLQVITQIKEEGFKNSQVMETLSYLTDVYGPRLTGSAYLKEASNWARDQLEEWGLENAEVASWGAFGNGWRVERYSAEMLSPRYMNIISQPKAWTPSTKGAISGEPILVDINDFNKEDWEGKLENKIILLGEPEEFEKKFEADANRLTEEELLEKYEAPEPGARSPYYRRFREYRERRRKRQEMSKFLREQGVGVVVQSSTIAHGTLRVQSGGSYKTAADNSLPTLVIALEHYNRIARLLKKEIPVQMEVNVQTQFETEDSLAYNVLAEIPGHGKLKDEIVMLGAHIDSWHSATGATDDGGGSAVMMEAMRILKAIGVKPRRTIRLALWSGEEQGLHGSRNYVRQHFGNSQTMELKKDHEKFSAYYNIDNGAGKIRGIHLQGNDACRPIFEAYLKPFHDLGVTTVSIRNTSSTDHIAFDGVGLPGFQFIQDPLDYFSRTWHTNMDFYDHVVEADLMQMSVVVASVVYHTAMRDEKLPRKPLPKK